MKEWFLSKGFGDRIRKIEKIKQNIWNYEKVSLVD